MGIFKRGLSRTRQSLVGRISQMLGNTEIDEDTWDDLEASFIQADLGLETTETVLDYLKETTAREGITRTNQLDKVLKESLYALLDPPPPLNITGRDLSIILIVGVNGSGKTTSIAKLANRFKKEGRNVMLAAGDTFRAAAIEQLQTWGERAGVPVIANKPGSDPGAVVYDAIQAAQARNADLLIIDTAGRLHNNYNLMRELEKIRNVISKAVPDAPHEVLLVLDGTTGQNALKQGQKFAEATNVTGLIITKLDGTARGGMIFSVFTEVGAPVQFIGLGEGIDDLVRFDVKQFVDGLFEF
ncbi:signal recognition particle-docking protein FtsY [Phototrophicus methaneseepsis]|uniref:Signal recognition particle receptor FtsY n=1 Tax=Phototrophicus methaneseepsis TaxID=2710758 RepID=A0A7S8IDJ7_9CHLR|nr:signal recognition particle-docking protein FtsY [Phototrophicus methaneseepsis]QPC81434.1 signal recognition particle-docking protein FtsY [Phototrophicus methaneseepsis]